MVKETWYYQIFNIKEIHSYFFNIKYLEKEIIIYTFQIRLQMKCHESQNIY